MEQTTARFCSNCGAPLSPDARFCHVCGAAVVASPTTPGTGAPEAPTTSISPPTYQPMATDTPPVASQAWSTSVPAVTTYASFGERFIALVMDWIILTLAFWVVGAVVAIFAFRIGGSSTAADVIFGVLISAMVIVVHWLYFAMQESSPRQATFGKRAMKIVVTDDQGNRLTFARASARAFARLLSSMFFSLGYLLALFTARKQTLHDLIASTTVLRK